VHRHDSVDCHECQHGQAWIQQQMDEKIAEYGWSMTYVANDSSDPDPDFAYTLGGSDPQFWVSGLSDDLVPKLLAIFKEQGDDLLKETGYSSWEEAAEHNAECLYGPATDDQLRHGIKLRKIDPREAEMFFAISRGCKLAIQLLYYDDDTKSWPDEEGYNQDKYPQKVLPEAL
jgi:hypothetical protein